MRVLQGTAAAVVACLALSGCQDDGKDPGKDASGSSTSSPSEKTPTEAPAAAGPVIKGDTFTVNVPEGWTKDKDFSTDFLDQYAAPEGMDALYVGEIEGEVRPLDDVAKDNFDRFATSGKKRKMATGDLAGDPAYHFTAQDGSGNFAEEFLAIHDGSQVTLGVVLSGTKAERQAVIDSILASWEWT